MAAVDLNSGGYIVMDQNTITRDDLATAAMASGSIPGIFPPRELYGHRMVDGGTVWNVNIDSAIDQCLEIVDDPADIIIDVLMCSSNSHTGFEISNNAMENWMNGFEIHKSYNGMNAVTEQFDAYPEIQQRYYFIEDDNGCPGSSMLDFNNSTTWCLQEAGRKQAQDILNIGQEAIHASLDDWYNATQEERAQHDDSLIKYLSGVFFSQD